MFDKISSKRLKLALVFKYIFQFLLEPFKTIAALKKHGKGEVILTTLSCLDGCLGCNPALDKLIINLIEKE